VTGANRSARLEAIRRLVSAEIIHTQEELATLMAERGFRVSQSTLSRDIAFLGILKRAGRGGASNYALPDAAGAGHEQWEALERILPDLVVRIDGAGHFVVLRTYTGAAQPVAVALDHSDWPEVIGTIAGDDTILILLHSPEQRPIVTARLESLANLA